MDLGRPVARHTIRRPHEVIDLDLDTEDPREPVAGDDQRQPEQQLRSERPEH